MSSPGNSSSSTRQALLGAAEKLFAQRGYVAVSTREIVQAAGVNLAAIKYHFGSKRELYLETVRWAVSRRQSAAVWDTIVTPPAARSDAARLLVAFLRGLVQSVLVDREPNPCARLMLQEALRPSEALDDIVRHYSRPREERMIALLAAVAPDAPDEQLVLAARGAVGQTLHYGIFRAFLERHEKADLSAPERSRRLADHIAAGTLRAIGCEAPFVTAALAEASPPFPFLASRKSPP